jgi:hypothetical protein
VDVARAETEDDGVGGRESRIECARRHPGRVGEKAQQRGFVPREIEIVPFDGHDRAAVEQSSLGHRVHVYRESFEEMCGILDAGKEFELAGRELVRRHFGDDVGVLPGGFERRFGAEEVGVRRGSVSNRLLGNHVESVAQANHLSCISGVFPGREKKNRIRRCRGTGRRENYDMGLRRKEEYVDYDAAVP